MSRYAIKIDDRNGRPTLTLSDDPYVDIAQRVIAGISTTDASKKAEIVLVQPITIDRAKVASVLRDERLIFEACRGGDHWIEANIPVADQERVRAEVERRGHGPDPDQTIEEREADAHSQGG